MSDEKKKRKAFLYLDPELMPPWDKAALEAHLWLQITSASVMEQDLERWKLAWQKAKKSLQVKNWDAGNRSTGSENSNLAEKKNNKKLTT